jgi:hypothetical protein
MAPARRRPSQAEIRKLAKALQEGRSAAPDYRGLAEYLIKLILTPERGIGRPSVRSSESEQQLLSHFEAIRKHVQRDSAEKLSVMAVLEEINRCRPRSRRHTQQELNTMEKRLSQARTARRRQTTG